MNRRDELGEIKQSNKDTFKLTSMTYAKRSDEYAILSPLVLLCSTKNDVKLTSMFYYFSRR